MKSELNKSGSNVSRTLGLGYFNLARGLGMVLIVLGHSINLYLEPQPTGSGGLFSGAGSVFFPEPAVCSEAGSWRHFS